METKIDFVVTWLDSSDPIWQEQYRKYKKLNHEGDLSDARYRNWDLFRYWFRALEEYAPWVNKVFLITNGKFPDWINKNHPKLVLVKHSDYIPKEFLPTFNSCAIELHMNKISGLSEHFVYFNDDFYINSYVYPEDYFKNGLPCDNNAESVFNVPIYSTENKFGIYMSILTNIGVINKHFNRWHTFKKSPQKWLGFHLGFKENMLSINLARQQRFIGFKWRHYEQPFLKSVMDEAWEKEPEMLNNSCTRFREEVILNPYFFRYWQFASNKFYPIRKGKHKHIYMTKSNMLEIANTLNDKKIKSVCLNDVPFCSNKDFYEIKNEIINLFNQKFPKKSHYEI